MQTNDQNIGFDPEQFLNEIIEEMNLQGDSARIEALKEVMREQMNHIILNTASLYLEPALVDAVLQEYEGMASSDFIFSELIANSFEAQWEILNALDEFKEETLVAYKRLAHAA